MESTITITSNAASNKISVTSMACSVEKAAVESFIKTINCGIISGKPNTAMMAAFWCALAAMADKKVNTKLKLAPPNNTNPMKAGAFTMGLPKNKVNSNKLNKLITTINSRLNNSLASTKLTGEVMVKKYNMRPRFSVKKLLATVLMQINNCITQKSPFHTAGSGASIDMNNTKMVAPMYKRMP